MLLMKKNLSNHIPVFRGLSIQFFELMWFMFLATSNKAKRLLCLNYSHQVRPEELAREVENVQALAAELPPGFRLLVDLSRLESMHPDSMNVIGHMMELFDRSGVGMIVRVIPDPSKDIGLNISSIFHYAHRPQVVICKTMAEAAVALAL
jgi:hypothetical protein